ncbi:hypothetical protein HDC34_002200 [Pseudoclavibacter sp. JAI123]|uniref:GIY-YIG nuclease family protein n=1 Tax=Pseudoclavibacter sp. JAI123 TaxID=2723065 RepID=UPI0015C72EE4|nr:GIY-YIG nuclease family protein [Pseudoclavibacter sp. JAI123]NYF13906.1 hypothetical protein [Pseudoclavibacter sp. JAI123]
MPADVVMMRSKLSEFFRQKLAGWDKNLGACKWGVYAFFDFFGEPIYVGQTREALGTRVNRHLTNQRTDAVAMRILDPVEVAEVRVWPLWELQRAWSEAPPEENKQAKKARQEQLKVLLNNYEHAAYASAVRGSKFHAVLNEKIPPLLGPEPDLDVPFSVKLYDGDQLTALRNADVRIARRAEAVSRLADVARERGDVSVGLRRAIVIQAVRLTHLSAVRLAEAEGRELPSESVIDSEALFGLMLPGQAGDDELSDDNSHEQGDHNYGPVDFIHADTLELLEGLRVDDGNLEL